MSGEITHFVAIGQDISARKQAEEARAQLAAIVESSSDAIEGITPQGTITSWNRGAEILYGYAAEEIVGKHVSILAPPDLLDEVSRLFGQVGQGERISQFRDGAGSKDARHIRVSLSMSPIKNGRGEVVGSSAIARDITDRLRAEEALRQSEEKYRSIVMNIPDVVWTVDSRGRFVFISPNIERFNGYTAEDHYQAGMEFFYQTVHPDEVQAIKESVEAAFRDRQPREMEYRTRHKDGSWIWARARAIGAFEKDGVQYLQGLLTDITERKRAEQELRANRQLLRTTLDSLRDAVFVISPDRSKILDCNSAATEMFGYRREEMVGSSALMLHVDADALPEFRRYLHEALAEKGYLQQYEFRMKRKDGTILATAHSVAPLVDDQGQRTGWVSLVQDITERKRAEEELALLKHSIDVCNDGAYWTDADDRLIYVNDAGCKALGYGREELIGKTMGEVIPNASPEILKRLWQCLRSQGFFSMDTVHRRKDGSEFPVDLGITYVQFGGKEFACGFARDITERKQAEQTLALAEEKYHSLVLNIPDVAWTVDSMGHLTYVSPNIEKLSGFSATEIVQDGVRLFRGGDNPDARRARASLEALFSRGEAYDLECRVQRKSGEWIWVHDRAVASYERDGVHYADGLLSDITERKRAEMALRESEQFNREVIASAQEGVVVYDREFRYQVWNRFMEELTSVPASEALGKQGFDLFPHIREQKVGLIIRRALAGEVVHAPDTPFHVPSTGKSGWVYSVFGPHFGVNGEIVGVIGIIADITDRKRAETALHESEERFRSLFENATVGIYRTNPAGEILVANPALVKMLGYRDAGGVERNATWKSRGLSPLIPGNSSTNGWRGKER